MLYCGMDEEINSNETNAFIVMWDCYGLESCVDITEDLARGNQFEHESIFERIKNPEEEPHNTFVDKVSKMVHMMQLRARFNPQREYEIYSVHTAKSVTKEQLESLFNQDPQSGADLIRERGTQLLSHRSKQERVIR